MPRTIHVAGDGLPECRQLDVRPDDSDSRDFIFSPSLQLTPRVLDPRTRQPLSIRNQGTEGACVGFALAAVINLSIGRWLQQEAGRARKGALRATEAVSERMLYEMARRHDEWKGESYEGTSLRGAMKGWHKHGVCARKRWPYDPKRPGHLDAARELDARRRPLGAYYRVVDSDVVMVQAAIAESDAVLASVWVHDGWQAKELLPPRRSDRLRVARIPPHRRLLGLHAIALVGYGPEGFLVQNSWGREWGTRGLAVLGYDDWNRCRQDAWVARPGAEAWDADGAPRVFVGSFMGEAEAEEARAGTSGAAGLDVKAEALPYIINTGDRGRLSDGGRLKTPVSDLPAMAARVRLAPLRHGGRDIILYAHGGLVSETAAAETASRLWEVTRAADIVSYFFVWETGITESLLGLLRSRDDASGPRAGFDFGTVWDAMTSAAKKALREAQRLVGASMAPLVRAGWDEMHGRAQGAAQAQGGAALFAKQVIAEMMQIATSAEPFRIHLIGHSAGSIYLARLYDQVLASAVSASSGRLQLGSIQFLAPAISIDFAKRIFAPSDALVVPKDRFRVFTLSDENEERDNIVVYPSSLLTYVADQLDDAKQRSPVLGIRRDLSEYWAGAQAPTWVKATDSVRHGEFDDAGHEVHDAIALVATSAS